MIDTRATVVLMLLIGLCGCKAQRDVIEPESWELSETLAKEWCVQFEADHRALGSGTIVHSNASSFWVVTSTEMIKQTGLVVVHWTEENFGQKFMRREFPSFQVVATDTDLRLALLQVEGDIEAREICWAELDSAMYSAEFDAVGVKPSAPKPLSTQKLHVRGKVTMRAMPDSKPQPFFRVGHDIDFKLLGSPLIANDGSLIGVAVGLMKDSTLFCDCDAIRECIDRAGVVQ